MKYFFRAIFITLSIFVLASFQGCYTQVGSNRPSVDKEYVDSEENREETPSPYAQENSDYEESDYYVDGAEYYLDGSRGDSLYEYYEGDSEYDEGMPEVANEYYFYDEDLGYIFEDPIYYDTYPYSYINFRVSGGYPYNQYADFGWYPNRFNFSYHHHGAYYNAHYFFDPFYDPYDPWYYPTYYPTAVVYPAYFPPYWGWGHPVYYPPP